MQNKSREFWPPGSEVWYQDACDFLDYPEVPLGDTLRKILRPTDKVLDLGCGFGVTSRYMAQYCQQVYALDASAHAIRVLEDKIQNQGVANVKPVCAAFPTDALPLCDVVVVLYVNRLIHSLASAKEVWEATGREGIYLCNHVEVDSGFVSEIPKRLGRKRKFFSCRNGCYVAGLLEALGAKVACEKVVHDFGQPVADMEDAARLLCRQTHLEEDCLPAIREMAVDYVETRRGRLYAPNVRTNCLIHFWR